MGTGGGGLERRFEIVSPHVHACTDSTGSAMADAQNIMDS